MTITVAIAAACFASACGDGTSAWILKAADAGSSGGDLPSVFVDAGAAGAAGNAGNAGPIAEPDAGTASPADAGVALRDPEDFAAVCAPQITVDNRTADANGALFDQAFPAPDQAMAEISRRVCALLYMIPDEVPASSPIVLIIDDFYGIGEVGISAPVIYMRLSSLHMQSVAAAGDDVREEITGALHYMLAVHYALDDESPAAVRWVTEGIAAWVRLRAGYASLEDRRPGGSVDEDYKTTGFFFDWLDRTYPDAVYLLNQALDPSDQVSWSERVFEQITGKDLAALWSDYQATL